MKIIDITNHLLVCFDCKWLETDFLMGATFQWRGF